MSFVIADVEQPLLGLGPPNETKAPSNEPHSKMARWGSTIKVTKAGDPNPGCRKWGCNKWGLTWLLVLAALRWKSAAKYGNLLRA